ncbi:response regulator [Catenovulum sp. SM1970]|uniref:hybrid sensor histidine kinase/response regulator n=1 Tax=Marinifaba aquimaris TaxID=2741323 RepID=UPI0015726402|nr:hybrid sensor histidine kinase/response regulator [Marinifaba aquimaris]NTS76083.1 response regulator [Marinifaba aquimaris]
MKLKQKILIFVLTMIVLPMSLLGGFAYYLTTISAQAQAKSRIDNQLSQQTQAIKNHFVETLSTLTLLSKSDTLEHYLRIDQQSERYSIALGPLLNLFADYSSAFQHFYEIRLVKANGTEDARFTANLLNNTTENESNTMWFKKAVLSDKDEFLTLDKNLDNDKTALYAVKKLLKISPSGRQLQGELWGYLVITIDPSVIKKVVMETTDEGGSNLIINKDGLVYFNREQERLLHSIPKFLLNKLISSSKENELIEISYNNQLRLFQAKALPFNYYLVSGSIKDVIYKDSRQLSMATIFLSVLMIMLAGILTFNMINRYLLSPISKLSQASRDVADGNLSIRLKVKKEDEIGSLFLSFNKMVSSILTSKKSLEHYKNHLEEKVESRTTELQQANQDLMTATKNAEQANKLKSRFLANMSHEIRTPLTAIIGFTEQAIKQEKQPELAQSSMNRVLKNSQHLLTLINDILDLSKIEAGKIAFENIDTSVFELLQDIENDCRSKAEVKWLDFKFEYQFPLPKLIKTDPTRLKQILFNLASNAIKFTEKGSVTICVSWLTQQSQLQIDVVDTGIGISHLEQQELFNPFTQADSSTTRNYGGTGLGLAISKHLADSLGYELTLESEKFRGSTFTLKINHVDSSAEPIFTKPDLVQIQQSLCQTEIDLSDKSILVAEDNPDNQALILLLLEPLNIHIDVVENGLLAVESALAEDYDLILMDMQMPQMSGIEATEMLRSTGFDQPIIALTANFMKSDISKYQAIGCDDSLAKPIDTEKLYQTIQKYLSPDAVIANQLSEYEQKLKSSDQYQNLSLEFKHSLPKLVTDLYQLADHQNWHKIASEAHKIKGSATSMGFPELTLLATDLERLAKESNDTVILHQLDKIAQSVDNINKECR